ncbi:Ig-like domain-containing protein, partial [Algoriella sp.]|uniref:Ig-like domain-containing protein n=1 Tax=Algoriella sp. TaxID=1872434 RepID=UPI002FC98F5C
MRKFYFLILFFIVWSNVWSQNLPSHLYASENTTIVYEGIHGSKRMSEDGNLGNLDVGYQGIYGVPVEGQVLLKFKLPVVPEGYEVETALLYFPIKGGVIQGAASFSLKASSSLNHNWTQNEVSNATLPTPIAGSTIARSVAMNAPTTKPVIGPYDFTSYVSNEIYKSNPHATFIFSAFSAEQAEAAKILHNEHYVKTTETHLGGTERPYLVITYTEVTEIEITGVTNGSFYRNNVTPHFNVGTATLNGAPYINGTTVTNEGTYTLTVTNGNKIQTIQFTIDKTRPTANIVINNGSSFTNHEYVDVRITPDLGVNDIVSMRYSVNESPISTTQAYQSPFSVGVGSENGEKSIRVELIDAAGNISPLYSWDFALNTTIPTGNLTINNGALYTTDRAVNLLIVPTAGSNEIVSMRFSNDNIYWSSLESYNPRKTYTLSSGDGNKTVYVQLLDRFGNVGVLQSSIFLDMTPPKASVLINNGGQYTNNTNVAIEITPDIGVNDITYIRYTINGLPPTTIAYTNSFRINVGSTNGEKEITITLFDAAWHSSTIYSATVTLDTLPPTATITTSKTSLKIGDVSTVTITFSEAVTGFDDGDLKAENGTLSGVLSTDGGITWTATFTPDPGITNTTNVITLDNTGVTDLAGNSGVATTDSNNYAIDTQQPNSPSNFQAIGKDRKVELSWDKNQETDFKQYNLYKIIDSVKSLLSTLPKGRLSYIDPNLTNGETYNYVLVAEDNIGNLSSETTISAKAIGEQKISFSPLSDIDYGDIISLGATASSELEVSYSSSDSTIAEVYQDINDQNKWKLKAKKVGLVVITANQSGSSNYLPAISISQNININVAQLKVTANAQNKVYGTLDPSLTFAVTGFKNNDQEANVLSGSLVRDAGENVGAYLIGKGSLVANSNYKIDFKTDSLTITKASLSGITFNSSSFVYDGTSKIIEISGNLPKGTSVTYAGNNQTETGVHQVIATIDGGTNYVDQTLNADLTITKASLSGITFNSSSF